MFEKILKCLLHLASTDAPQRLQSKSYVPPALSIYLEFWNHPHIHKLSVDFRLTSVKREVTEEWIDNKLQVRSEPVPWHKNLYLLKNKKMGGNTYNATTSSCGL
jgi:hypothetical protein